MELLPDYISAAERIYFAPDAEMSPAEIALQAHGDAIRNVANLAFKQWPVNSFYRQCLIDAAVHSAKDAIERLLPISKKMQTIIMDEHLRYYDANRDDDKEATLQCLESMLYVYELLI